MSILTNKYLFAFLIFAAAIANVFSITYAGDKDFPPLPKPPRLVSDLAGFMNSQEQTALEQKLVAYSDSTSNEIAIVTVQSIGQYDIADYSVQLYNKWKIGGKKNNNGLLILAAKDERKIWITTGYGLEGALPDGLIGQIIREEIEPNFKRGDFYAGFEAGTNALMDAARGEYTAEPKSKSSKGGGGIGTILLILFILFILFSASNRGGGGGGLMNSAGWIAASMLSNRHSGSGWGGGGFGGGSSGGGGFGGFGGGSSGGGGAGGSW
jgi:uncharacterized protein